MKTPTDPRTIFRYADAFSQAADRAFNEQYKKLPPGTNTPIADAAHVAPCATLDSFALELYLKSLQAIELGQARHGHDCKKLFEALPKGTQDAIKFQYNSEYATAPIAKQLAEDHPRMPMGFDPCLEMSRKVFERVRYLFEGTGGEQWFYWPMLRHATRRTILNIHPDWAEAR